MANTKNTTIKHPNEPMTWQQGVKIYSILAHDLGYTKQQASDLINNLIAKASGKTATTSKEEAPKTTTKAKATKTSKEEKAVNTEPKPSKESKKAPKKSDSKLKFTGWKVVNGKQWGCVDYAFADKEMNSIRVKFTNDKYAFDIPNTIKTKTKKGDVVFVINKDNENFFEAFRSLKTKLAWKSANASKADKKEIDKVLKVVNEKFEKLEEARA